MKSATFVWPAALVLCSMLVCPALALAQSQSETPPAEAFWEPQTPQPLTSSSNQRRDDLQIRIAAAVWASGVMADQITTYQFSSQYHDLLHETNPLIRGLDRHPTLLVAAGSALDAATGWAAYRFLAPKHPRIAKVAFYGFAAYRIYLAAYNVQMMQRADLTRASVTR